MAQIGGEILMARSLKQQGVDYMFGGGGVRVWGAASAAQREGIQFIGMRNEQSVWMSEFSRSGAMRHDSRATSGPWPILRRIHALRACCGSPATGVAESS